MSDENLEYDNLIIDESNETTPLLNDSTLIYTPDNQNKSSPDQNYFDDINLTSVSRTSTRRRVPPKRIIENKEQLMLNLSASNNFTGKRFKLVPKLEPVDEPQQTQIPFQSDGLTNEESDPNIKPRHSYSTLIIMALLSTPNYTMALNDLYRYIAGRFAYYRNSTSSWQNGIRHNLSMNKLFQKLPRTEGHSGKGSYWTFAEHVNPHVQFSQHLQQASMPQQPTQQFNHTSSPINRPLKRSESNGGVGTTHSNSNYQSSSHPLQTLILEQLQNAATNGAYSSVNPLFGTTTPVLNENVQEKVSVEKRNATDPLFGLPQMSHEQLAMAQSNWYIAQLATQKGFALVPEFYERCLKQIQAYYKQEPELSSSNAPDNQFGFNESIERLEVARDEDEEE